jgi:reductive dehalogenase
MTNSIYLIFQTQLILSVIFILVFSLFSFYEKEKNAGFKALLILFLVTAIGVAQYFNIIPFFLQLLFATFFLGLFFLVLLPFGNKAVEFQIPTNKFDERDVMFSRMELIENTQKFKQYYSLRPENKAKDDLFRKEPGLLSAGAKLYNPFLFHAAEATFSTVNLLQPLVETQKKKKKSSDYSESEISDFIKKWAIKLGAKDVGFTLVKPHHIYSHIGRGENYGKALELSHKYAIAFTVEMSHDSIQHSPQGTIITESSQQYFNAGAIAVQIAEFIRNMGFDARSHIDANYRVICPVVAMDAGLGTIGRMGLLMTPKQGPRVRIGVVTTDLKVEINQKPFDSSVIHFCNICKKCAVNCPSNAISSEKLKKEKLSKRWTINHESCFTYWTKIGTDCGRCIAVCPCAHQNNLVHNLVRSMLKINPVNRWIALKLDNYFYGEKPPVRALEKWMVPRKIKK